MDQILHFDSVLFYQAKSLSRVRLFATPWTVASQVPLSMGFSRQYTGVDCHFLLQGIFPTQGLNPGLQHCRQTLYHLSHEGSVIEGSQQMATRVAGFLDLKRLECNGRHTVSAGRDWRDPGAWGKGSLHSQQARLPRFLLKQTSSDDGQGRSVALSPSSC